MNVVPASGRGIEQRSGVRGSAVFQSHDHAHRVDVALSHGDRTGVAVA